MSAALRSVLVVNRSSMIGTAAILALSAILLTATGSWVDASLRNEDLTFLATVASSFAGTVVMITVFIVASVFSGALRPRRREFALMRAVGATATQVRSTVTAEALVLLLIVAPVGAVAGLLVAPLLTPLLVSSGMVPAGFLLPFSPISVLATLTVLVATGVLAARITARGILRVSPTAAVRESTIEPAALSRGRLLTAAALAIIGVLAAGTPFVFPGALGSATGATSAILLIIAAGLAGPALVRWAAIRGGMMLTATAGAGRVLAFANTRGFSRRLSAAVIPLALFIALGSVQSGVNSGIMAAAESEIRAGVTADLVVVSPSGVTLDQAAALAALPGVTATTSTGQVTGAVRVDNADEDVPFVDDLNWEATSILAISAGEPLIDPSVESGSLGDLEAPGTIALSREALVFTGKGVGDTVDVRIGEEEVASTIVAVYERSLGFGDFITGTTGARAASEEPVLDAVFIDSPNADPATLKAVADMGLTVTDASGYARMATQGAGGEQQLSLVLLLALLGFVAAAAANTLASSIRSRREEFALLMRLGATRTQVMGTVAIEAGFIIVTALGIGLLAVVPALLGVGQGLLGVPLPVFDLPVTGVLMAASVLITILTVLPVAWLATSPARTSTPRR